VPVYGYPSRSVALFFFHSHLARSRKSSPSGVIPGIRPRTLPLLAHNKCIYPSPLVVGNLHLPLYPFHSSHRVCYWVILRQVYDPVSVPARLLGPTRLVTCRSPASVSTATIKTLFPRSAAPPPSPRTLSTPAHEEHVVCCPSPSVRGDPFSFSPQQGPDSFSV